MRSVATTQESRSVRTTKRSFTTFLATIAIIAVLGAGAVGTKAWAVSMASSITAVQHNQKLSSNYRELVQSQIQPLQ